MDDGTLQEIISSLERCWVGIGTVSTTPAPNAIVDAAGVGARMVRGVLRPSGVPFEARLVNPGQGAGKGIFVPVAAGDEVTVVFPDANPNRAICWGGLGSAAAPNPTANTGDKILLMHPGGVELRSLDGLTSDRLVLEAFIQRQQPIWIALQTFMSATSPDTFATPTVGPAAAAFMSAVGTDLAQLIIDMGTTLEGLGPLSSPSHKATL